ncbi:protein shortage in chiasmata 1 ortholog-like [Amphiura filiformis]|uniref:protein shortage in chiasmata 1 ortholog-like n=1 Tax=Amphiura filiformis TaxID=82378 RepID=UPI003B20DBE5
MHPKLLAIIRQISDWYKRKINKDGGDNDPKILVIIRREARKLVEVVAESLAIVQGITTATSESSQMMYDAVSKQLDTCNCLILLATQIGQDFPWALFSLVVEYEYIQGSAWLELCQRQNIRHIALKTIPATGGTADMRKGWQSGILEGTEEDTSTQSQGGKALKLIASADVILCSQLLQLLESKHDIMLLERNYSKMISDSSSNKLYFADLIVDEQSGIVLQELHQLSEAHTVEPVVNRMTKLSLQYSVCWLILYTNKGKHTGYPLGGQTVNNLARLQAALTQFSIKNDGYEVKVLFADGLCEVAQLIRQIVDNAAKTTRNWNQADWHTRSWLTNTVSKHEKVLLQFPCLNAYSAQIMLTAAPLKKLLTMSLPELISTCPWIQHKTLKASMV